MIRKKIIFVETENSFSDDINNIIYNQFIIYEIF